MSFKRFFQRRSRRQESALELEAYLQRETEENIERGMSPANARRAAHVKLGNVTNILGDMSQQDTFGPLETLWQDLRFGVRMLLKHRGFALVSLLTLAIGIGANTAIFTVVDAALIRPLPYPNANRTVMIWEHRLPDGERQNVTSPATFLNWQQDNTVFEQMAAMFNDSSILSGGDTPEQIGTGSVSPNFFSILGVNAAIGRIFVPAQDGSDSSSPAALLSFQIWQRRFASDPNILGTQITLDDHPFTVVGVLPRNFDFFVKQQSFSSKKPEIWHTMNFSPADRARHGRYLQAIGLLRPGVTLPQAQDAMLSLSSRLVAQDPASMKNWSVNLVPLRSQLTGDVAQGLRLLLAAVGMLSAHRMCQRRHAQSRSRILPPSRNRNPNGARRQREACRPPDSYRELPCCVHRWGRRILPRLSLPQYPQIHCSCQPHSTRSPATRLSRICICVRCLAALRSSLWYHPSNRCGTYSTARTPPGGINSSPCR